MKKIVIINFIAIIMLSNYSCIKEFTFETEETENKLVVNGFVKNTEPIELTVTRSFSLSGTSKVAALSDAAVAIFAEDIFIENLTYSQGSREALGKFSTSFIPVPSTNYRVEVSHPVFPAVEASAEVPLPRTLEDTTVKFVGGNNYNFSFTMKNTTEKPYYYLKMYFRSYILDSLTQEREYVWHHPVEIPVTAIPDGQRYLDNGYIFSGETLGTEEVTIAGVAKFNEGIISHSNELEELNRSFDLIRDHETMIIHLETLSEDAYKYYSSQATYLNLNGLDIFGEATSLFSNVENGYGIFAGVDCSIVGVTVER